LSLRHNIGQIVYSVDVANGVVYISPGTSIVALNASNGSSIWVHSITAKIEAISTRLGIVYALDSDHDIVYAFSLQTGNQLWSY
jgi:outer membrane protein assembly factor BamB